MSIEDTFSEIPQESITVLDQLAARNSNGKPLDVLYIDKASLATSQPDMVLIMTINCPTVMRKI